MQRIYIAVVGLVATLALTPAANAIILNGSQTLNAGQNMAIDLTIDTVAGTVGITMTGPEAVWYGVGFETLNHPNAVGTYAIVALGGALGVEEYDLGRYGGGSLLTPSIAVDLNTTSAGVRTVELSGDQAGLNYTFPTTPTTMDISWAYGDTSTYEFHEGGFGETTLSLAEIPEPSTMVLAAAGLLCLVGYYRWRR